MSQPLYVITRQFGLVRKYLVREEALVNNKTTQVKCLFMFSKHNRNLFVCLFIWKVMLGAKSKLLCSRDK